MPKAANFKKASLNQKTLLKAIKCALTGTDFIIIILQVLVTFRLLF